MDRACLLVVVSATCAACLFLTNVAAPTTSLVTASHTPVRASQVQAPIRSGNIPARQWQRPDSSDTHQSEHPQAAVSTSASTHYAFFPLGFGFVAILGAALKALLQRPQYSKSVPLADCMSMAAMAGQPRKRIVVTGMGVASVFGNDVDSYYDALLAGKSGVSLIERFDVSGFPTKFAGEIKSFNSEGLIPAKNDKRYDDTIRYALVAGKRAILAAGIDKEANPDAHEKLDKAKVGVLIASGMGGLGTLETGVNSLESKGVKAMSPFVIPFAIANMGGSLVAIEQGFMGPNYSIATACASANYAFTAAADHIRSGRADIMVTGGAEGSICPVGLGGFVACRALSKRNDDPQAASRPWDKARDGFVMGEGAGVLVLESLDHALARGANIVAEYLGGAITTDAYHMTMPREDGLGVASCIEMAINDAGIERDQVNYINAHATSTDLGDIAEVKAIKKVFSSTKGMKMNATKSLIGHCLGAAGGMEAVATIKAITTGYVHPTLNLTDPIEEVGDMDCVPHTKQLHEITAAISNSFGFGGHNSVCVFGPYKP